MLFVWILVAFVSFLYLHELAHQRIFAEYGIDSHIQIGPISKGALFSTVANETQMDNLYNNDLVTYNSLMESESNVDAIGYQVGFLLLLILVVLAKIGW